MFIFRKKRPNTCYTYFRIVGYFDPDEMSRRLELQPFKAWKSTDIRRDGRAYGFSSWCFGKCEAYEIYTSIQMEKTIEPLKDKVDILNEIRNEYDVEFYLEIVPWLRSYNTKPYLTPSLDVMEFCLSTRTELDLDLYIPE